MTDKLKKELQNTTSITPEEIEFLNSKEMKINGMTFFGDVKITFKDFTIRYRINAKETLFWTRLSNEMSTKLGIKNMSISKTIRRILDLSLLPWELKSISSTKEEIKLIPLYKKMGYKRPITFIREYLVNNGLKVFSENIKDIKKFKKQINVYNKNTKEKKCNQ